MKIFSDRHLLMLAWKLLRDPSQRWRKIGDIATASGFSNISDFNRAFRSRFGATPSDIRAANDCELAGGDARTWAPDCRRYFCGCSK